MNSSLRFAGMSRVEREELSFKVDDEKLFFEASYAKLNREQLPFVDKVIDAIDNSISCPIFLDAISGAGKTFCENVLLSYARPKGHIALATA
jgi:hypothetical protein